MSTLSTNTGRLKVLDITYIAMFAAIMAVCSWISIPSSIPFTMQTFGVFLSVGVLGGKRGTLSVLTYLMLGLIGVPVFAGFSGGIGCLAGATGGYIVGFFFSALTMWCMESLFGKGRLTLLFSMVLGLFVCYAFGTVWYMTVYTRSTGSIGLYTALSWCVFPYVIPDMLKIALAFIICKRLDKIVKRP